MPSRRVVVLVPRLLLTLEALGSPSCLLLESALTIMPSLPVWLLPLTAPANITAGVSQVRTGTDAARDNHGHGGRRSPATTVPVNLTVKSVLGSSTFVCSPGSCSRWRNSSIRCHSAWAWRLLGLRGLVRWLPGGIISIHSPLSPAIAVTTDTTDFAGNLSATDTTVQSSLGHY